MFSDEFNKPAANLAAIFAVFSSCSPKKGLTLTEKCGILF